MKLILREWEKARAYPGMRLGQALFTSIWIIDPEAAEELRGSDMDPFYKDGNIGRVITFLNMRYGEW